MTETQGFTKYSKETLSIVVARSGGTSNMVVKRRWIESVTENEDGTTFIVFNNGPSRVAVTPGYEVIAAWFSGTWEGAA